MKILLIHDYAELIGGAEVGALTLRNGFRQRGHDARLFAARTQPNPKTSIADYTCLGTTSRFRGLLQTVNPWAYWRLKQVLADFQPDVVHVRMFLTQLSPLILPLLQPIPSLYHVVWYRPICPRGSKLLPNGTPCQTAAGLACYQNRCLPLQDWLPLMGQMQLWQRWRSAFDCIVANSYAVQQQLLAAGISPVRVIWNGVPVLPARPPLTAPPTIAVAARLVPEKGVDVLLQAVAAISDRIPNLQVLVAGHGPQFPALQQLAHQLGIANQVTLLGHLPRAQVEAHFAKAWVQVVPSRWAEPFGFVAPEAMMRGTAVIASHTGGLAEIVQEGTTGFLVPPGDVDALADALVRVLSDRTLAERLGAHGRERALQHFSESVWIDQFLQLYRTLG
ncbi:MAG: glycosyltransferase family 4 protein [Cyanobacteria bacterium]|nr:glycosyltransferase family 4 protein [Cyanobacteriota bacterium]MDW8202433.1 glycosyltransferase family 4 protein [Cyanobacteriota bacterium SKYGB_h_bin112]